MIVPNYTHIKFYEHQIKAHEDKWREYAKTAMDILIQEKKLFVGRIWGIQSNQGNVILRFREGEVPRMKQMYFLGFVGNDASEDPMKWNFSYETFRTSVSPKYYSGISTDIYTVTYWKKEGNWSYIIVSGFELDLLQKIQKKYLSQQKHPLIIIAETDPPVDYLIKLKEYVSKNPNDSILIQNVDVEEDEWKPTNLDNSADITAKVINILEAQELTIVQGPPGTGKSYLAADICKHYLLKNNSICVTALTNKALIEIADKDGLKQPINEGMVMKTNLSSDEHHKNPNIRNVQELTPNRGELLLSTYYKLSQKHAELLAHKKRFDLLIIEEASQAFLATLSMFKTLARKVLIIGDHKQLVPIVIKPHEIKVLHSNITGIINGLETLAFNNNSLSFRLTKTRRLTSHAAQLTSVYYDNTLSSMSDLENNTRFNTKFDKLFHPKGGYTLIKLSSDQIGYSESDLLNFICRIAYDAIENNPQLEVALLSPYINIESKLYDQYIKKSRDFSRLTISTILKIQGLTSDITILYLPLIHPAFDVDDNLFNVATSRAKRGTIIITFEHIHLIKASSPETLSFINKCSDITPIFKEYFKVTK